jgi:L-alanine-DL-glutamate epimerase-like enolase superfamily enzyme
MKISLIESFCTEFVGFVRVTAEDGSIGWGQLSTYNADITQKVLHRQVAPWVLGRDVSTAALLDDLLDLVTEKEHKFPGSYVRRAMAGFDTAIWDWYGRQQGKPVAALLGGSAGQVRAYASSMKRDITPQDEAARMCDLRDRYGFDAFKVRAGAEVGRNRDEWPGRTEAIIRTMRQSMGGSAALLIDANSCYTPERAIEVGEMLQDYGFCHFEEPCPYWELEQTKQVTETLDIDVTGGEQDCDLPTWRRMIDMRAVDILQPDILYLGGISRTLRVANMAASAGSASHAALC